MAPASARTGGATAPGVEVGEVKAIAWHVRGNCTSTIKEGWRPADITVSADFEEGAEPSRGQYQQKVDGIHEVLDAFCQQRNQESGKLTINGTSISHSGAAS